LLSIVPLLTAAAFVGILHMSAPDHWVTLVILGRISKWTRTRLFGVSIMTAIGHVALSILLGFVILGLGLAFSQRVSFDITRGTGAIMVIAGIIYGVRELRAIETKDYQKEAKEEFPKGGGTFVKRFSYFAVLGAALSPDLGILPIFLLAIPGGSSVALDVAVVFASSSVLALSVLVWLGSTGMAKTIERIPAKYNNAMVGFVVAAVGSYVLLAR